MTYGKTLVSEPKPEQPAAARIKANRKTLATITLTLTEQAVHVTRSESAFDAWEAFRGQHERTSTGSRCIYDVNCTGTDIAEAK